MTTKEIQKSLLGATGRYIRKLFGEMEPRLLSLEQQIKRFERLEARITYIEGKGIDYRGVWDESEDYQRGDAVTHQGSLWICTVDHPAQMPPCAGWQLAVKKGRDGKDAR